MASCKACEEPLVFQGEDENGQEVTHPDDVLMTCGCHFHWQCLLDESTSIAVSLKCPSCDSYLPTNEPGPSSTNQFLHTSSSNPILVQYTNEGGVQKDLDVLPAITEEAYLESNPEARPAKAFHVMCTEGDVAGMIDLLSNGAEDGLDVGNVLRFQDPLAEGKSALHLAVENGHEEAVWLLLWLASTIQTGHFPEQVREQAESAGIGRTDILLQDDIRVLKDGQGKTAEDYARASNTSMRQFAEGGLFSV